MQTTWLLLRSALTFDLSERRLSLNQLTLGTTRDGHCVFSCLLCRRERERGNYQEIQLCKRVSSSQPETQREPSIIQPQIRLRSNERRRISLSFFLNHCIPQCLFSFYPLACPHFFVLASVPQTDLLQSFSFSCVPVSSFSDWPYCYFQFYSPSSTPLCSWGAKEEPSGRMWKEKVCPPTPLCSIVSLWFRHVLTLTKHTFTITR